MKELKLNIYEKGEQVYIIKKEKVKETCEFCDGKGFLEYKGKKLTCNVCNGDKELKTNKIVYTALKEPCTIADIDIKVRKNIIAKIEYRGYMNSNVKEKRIRPEFIFNTYEEAERKANELNNEQLENEIFKKEDLKDGMIVEFGGEELYDCSRLALIINNNLYSNNIILYNIDEINNNLEDSYGHKIIDIYKVKDSAFINKLLNYNMKDNNLECIWKRYK